MQSFPMARDSAATGDRQQRHANRLRAAALDPNKRAAVIISDAVIPNGP